METSKVRQMFPSRGEVAKALRWCARETEENDVFSAGVMRAAAEMLEEGEKNECNRGKEAQG